MIPLPLQLRDAESRQLRARYRCRVLAVYASILMLALVLTGGFGALKRTSAAWTDEENAAGTFEAVELGAVEGMECYDSENLLDLVNNQLRLDWEPPIGVPEDTPIEYVVTVDGEPEPAITETEYLFTAQLSLVDIFTDIEVLPQIEGWEGPAVGVRARTLGVLVPLRVSCDAVLGII